MDLKELVPPVPEDVPVLVEKPSKTSEEISEGIYVVTLQLWLKMLGYDNKLKVNGIYDEEVKARVLKFKRDKMSIENGSDEVDYTMWVKMDELLREKLPPDPEALERTPFPELKNHETEEAYLYAVRMGLEAFGFQIDVPEKEYFLEIDSSGIGILENIPVGIYTLEIDNDEIESTGSLAYDERAGSVEIHLYDKNESPIKGKVKLTCETPELESLHRTIRLFKALAREVDKLEDRHGKKVNPKIVDGELRASIRKVWDEFPISWGQFYGAPWMGIMFDPTDEHNLTFNPGTVNWATYETIELLYNWGKKHLENDDNPNYGLIGVRHLNYSTGGNTIMEKLTEYRSDFSHTGQSVSLHLPRKSSRSYRKGTETGQMYGGVDYNSDQYNAAGYEIMFTTFAPISFGFQIRCPDKGIVDRLKRSLTGRINIQFDSFEKNRTINASVNRMTLLKRKDPACKVGYKGFPWVHDENGRIINWRCIDLNFDKQFVLDPKPNSISLDVPSGIAAPILNVNQHRFPSIYKIRKGNLYPMVNTESARLLPELMNSYGGVMLRYSNSYIEYKKAWNFWYYFELDQDGKVLSDYSLHLYGIRFKDGAYDLIKACKHYESNPLKILNNAGYDEYSPGWWRDANPPHVPSLHVTYSTNADRSVFDHIEGYSLRTGQIMGRFDNDGTNYTRRVDRAPADASGYYPLTNVYPTDMTGSYLVHVDNGFINVHVSIDTPGQGYILFVWEVLVQEQGNSQLLHELRPGTTITQAILDQIRLAYNQLRDSKVSSGGTLRDRGGRVLIQAGRLLIEPNTLIPTNLRIIRTGTVGIEQPRTWVP